jgi:hypothetical protein
MKPEGSWFALVCDTPVGLDQVQAVRPTGVCRFDLIVEAIDQGLEFDAQLANAHTGYRGAFLLVARAAEEDVVANVALHLPHVGRMGFKDVDRVEIDLALVLLRKLIQGGNLTPKGRSRVAAEDENDRLLRPQRRQSYWGLVFKSLYGEIGRGTADVQAALRASNHMVSKGNRK